MSSNLSAPAVSSIGTVVQPQATPERPWLGLANFTEADRDYFYGRDAEIRELTDRVRRAPLTVLYGVSGYGKSSLIGAGLIPALRDAKHPVVLLRRCYDDLALRPLHTDVIAACIATMPSCVQPETPGAITLWEFFHDRRQPWFQPPEPVSQDEGAEPPDSTPWPVLLLDQFEEIFIKGEDRSSFGSAASERAQTAAYEFLTQLADLVENRPPESLQRRLQSGQPDERRALVRQFDFQARPVRVAVAVRDDFLARLERWRRVMPSLMEHRVELRLLSGKQAFKAVFEPGTKRLGQLPILPREVATAIVVAAAGARPDVPIEEIDAVPPILSLLCERLNDRRLAASPALVSITAADFSPAEAERILTRFYDDKLGHHPKALREFLEDKLVSDSGFRENVTLDSAVGSLRSSIPDVEARLRQLVDDRVLVIEDRGGVPRVELTHDTLARLGLDRRGERQVRARRVKAIAWTVSSIAVAVFSLGLTLWALSQRAEAGRQAEIAAKREEEAKTAKAEAERQADIARGSEKKAEAAKVDAEKQAALATNREEEAKSEKARAFALIRFMDAQVGEAFVDNVPVQLRERVSAQVDEFYTRHGALATLLNDHERLGYYIRKARVHFAAIERYMGENLAENVRELRIRWEREGAASALKEAQNLGESLATKSPDDHTITRSRILAHHYLATLASQLKESEEFAKQSRAAREILAKLVAGGPFSEDSWVDWMELPKLVAATGDRAAGPLTKEAVGIRPRNSMSPSSTDQPVGHDPKPHTNGLEMQFRPVPGTKVQFSVYQTRVQDFQRFVRETGYIKMRETADAGSRMWSIDKDGQKQRGHSWDNLNFVQTDHHPVVGVSWEDAKAFCRWLTIRERAAGRLPNGCEYRLPTDHEWSVAVGLEEDPKKSPEDKNGRMKNKYPWGDMWPALAGSGNYAGEEANNGRWPFGIISGYNDGFPRTAPVGSFRPNQLGIYDLGGNVVEWCEDHYRAGSSNRVSRGASFADATAERLLLSFRYEVRPSFRNDFRGFRCVFGSSSRVESR